jgi:tetratricopeptide (TPR) repeat protein
MDNIGAILEQAQLLLNQGRSKDAINRIKQALATEPENDYALSLLGRCLFHTREYEKGIQAIRTAISYNPQESFYYYLLAFGYYQNENIAEARSNLQKAIQLNPYYAEYYGLLAFVMISDKQFEAGLERANEGLAIEAENLTCLNARAMALNKLKRTEAAIATMQDALAQDPDNEFTHTSIGWNLLERGKHQEAAKHFREALRIAPDRPHAQSGLKEALKSKIPPYKWLLQYSFWVNNQGKKLKTILPIALFIIFRILLTIFKNNRATTGLAWVLAGIYLLFVIGSWTMNSIANFFLLFHPDGKYALTNTERWSAITVVSALCCSALLIVISLFTQWTSGTRYDDSLVLAGLICLSLALPLGEIDYPLNLKDRSGRNIYSLLLIATGMIALIAYIFMPAPALYIMGAYGVAFIIYNWSGVLRFSKN